MSERAGATFCYLTDFEHDGGAGDAEILRLAKNADLALLDATYTPEEYPRYVKFGHSTWQHCGELCAEAGVKSWGMFHHMHMRTDADQHAIEQAAQKAFPNSFAVRQGQHFQLAAKSRGRGGNEQLRRQSSCSGEVQLRDAALRQQFQQCARERPDMLVVHEMMGQKAVGLRIVGEPKSTGLQFAGQLRIEQRRDRADHPPISRRSGRDGC